MPNIYFYNKNGSLTHVCPDHLTAIEYVFQSTGLKLNQSQFKASLQQKCISVCNGLMIYISDTHIKGVNSIKDRGFTPPVGNKFQNWWRNIGSGITPKKGEDMEQFAKRVCECFYHQTIAK